MKKRLIFIVIFCFFFSTMSFAKEPLQWACTNYKPAYYKAASGKGEGYLYDIAIEALEKRMGIPVVITFLPWKRCQLLVSIGEADMIFTIPTSERLEYALTHEQPAWIKKRVLYTYKGHPRIKEIDELRGFDDIKNGNFSILSYIGNGWLKAKVEKIGLKVDYARKIELIYRKLARKRGDIIIEQPCLADPNIQKLKLTNQIVKTRGIGAESGFHILIGKKSVYSDILPELNKVIVEMRKDGTIDNILKDYGM